MPCADTVNLDDFGFLVRSVRFKLLLNCYTVAASAADASPAYAATLPRPVSTNRPVGHRWRYTKRLSQYWRPRSG